MMQNAAKATHSVLAYAILVASAITIQTTVLHFWPFQMLFVDLGLIVVIWAGLARGPRSGMSVGFITGLLEDSLSGSALGTNALVKTLVGAFCGALGTKVLPNSPVAHLLALFACSLLDYVLLYLLQTLTAPESLDSGRFVMLMIAGVLSTAVLGMIIFRFLSKNRFYKPLRVPDDVTQREHPSAG
ncbi:MAG: rod shape-determining protein MreD [Candidatus Coatesbacteria bacterium]|nr:rod shape-determining protein MreD [Candidatus Coatesbacteria bacterium]